jgi:hypothetical protein
VFPRDIQEADNQVMKALEHNAAAAECYVLRAKIRQHQQVRSKVYLVFSNDFIPICRYVRQCGQNSNEVGI